MDRSYRIFGRATMVMLAVVTAVLAMLLAFQQSLQQQIRSAQLAAPILVTRALHINAGTKKEMTQPLGWPSSARQQLLQGLEPLGRITGLSREFGFVRRASGRYVPVTRLQVGADLLGYLGLPRTCRPDVVYLSDSRDPLSAHGSVGRYNGAAVQLLPLASSTALKVLASHQPGALAVSCQPKFSGSVGDIVFLPRPGKAAAALAALRARGKTSHSKYEKFAPTRVTVRSLSAAVAQRITTNYGWLLPFVIAFASLLLVILVGFALFDATRSRPEFQIRRAIGASMPSLLRSSAGRVAKMLGAAVALAIMLVALYGLFADTTLLRQGWPGLVWTLVVLLIAGLLAVAAHAAYVLLRLDARLTSTTNVAGSRWKTAMVGVCMAVMTFSLAVFAMFAFGLNSYFQQLQNTALGYAPAGLYAYAAIPVSKRAREGHAVAALMAVPLQSLKLAGGKTSFVCYGPWTLDAMLANPRFKHAGIAINGGANMLGVMGIAHTGRDISAKDLQTGTASWVQSDDPEYLRSTRKFGNVIGTVSGVLVGALAPELRSITFRPSSNSSLACPMPAVLFRPGSDAGASAVSDLRTRLQTRAPEYKIQAPQEVSAMIARARQPLSKLKHFADLGFAAAFLCMLLVASLTSAAWVNSRARIIAIRSALGEAPWRAALAAVGRACLQAVPALVLAALVSYWANALVRYPFPAYTGLSVWQLAGLCLALGVVIQMTLFAWLWKALVNTNFSAALRVD